MIEIGYVPVRQNLFFYINEGKFDVKSWIIILNVFIYTAFMMMNGKETSLVLGRGLG